MASREALLLLEIAKAYDLKGNRNTDNDRIIVYVLEHAEKILNVSENEELLA
jgi:hypothetical protein